MDIIKIIAIVIVGLILVLAVGYAIPIKEQNEKAAVARITFEITTADSESVDETHKLSMDIPFSITLTDGIIRGFDFSTLATESFTVDTDIVEGTEVLARATVDVWWESQDIKSINSVKLEQSALDSNGNKLMYSGAQSYVIGETETSTSTDPIPLETSSNDPVVLQPNNFFDRIYLASGIDPVSLWIQYLDGSTWTSDISVNADRIDDLTRTYTTSLTTNLNVNYNEVDASLSISASVRNIGGFDNAGA
jgi:hypothetical protein